MLECTEETNYVPLINGEFQYPSLKSNTEKCNILLKFKLIDNNVLLIEESFH
jgi:hypothetical protein